MPQKKGAYEDQAKKTLVHLVDSGGITAHTTKTDRYGRTIAKVFSQRIDVNLALIQESLT
ncbi:MAG: thermonuclease family protein [Undibacterium sp.]|nr:thermonuclease family protein [Undibacterium sp.]